MGIIPGDFGMQWGWTMFLKDDMLNSKYVFGICKPMDEPKKRTEQHG